MIIAILWRELLACRLGSCAASAMAATAKVLPLLHALFGPCAAALRCCFALLLPKQILILQLPRLSAFPVIRTQFPSELLCFPLRLPSRRLKILTGAFSFWERGAPAEPCRPPSERATVGSP